MLYAVLDTVKAVDTSAPATSLDFFLKGRAHFVAADYAQAAGFYARALDLERRERRLGRRSWRELVEEPVDAYGAAGDLQAARETVEYGLSPEPDYARFHYLMAVIHAAREDPDATITSLEQAFRHKATLGDGPRLPDPRTHPPFRRFAQNEKFRAAAKKLKP